MLASWGRDVPLICSDPKTVNPLEAWKFGSKSLGIFGSKLASPDETRRLLGFESHQKIQLLKRKV